MLKRLSDYCAAKMYKFKVQFLHLWRSKYVTTRDIREPSSHPSPTQESTKLQGSFVNLSAFERQKLNLSLEENMMINDRMKCKPSFVKTSKRFVWKKGDPLKVSSAENICACVFAVTLVRVWVHSDGTAVKETSRLQALIQRCCNANMLIAVGVNKEAHEQEL